MEVGLWIQVIDSINVKQNQMNEANFPIPRNPCIAINFSSPPFDAIANPTYQFYANWSIQLCIYSNRQPDRSYNLDYLLHWIVLVHCSHGKRFRAGIARVRRLHKKGIAKSI